ncbi:MAG: polymerase [Chloroflexia bacterium]|nr:polymerase [Chloroflexia bacterium]
MQLPRLSAVSADTTKFISAIVVAIVLCLGGAALLVYSYFWVPFVVIAAIALTYKMLGNVRVMLTVMVLLITVLPFGTLPFRAVITPSLLSVAIVALIMMRLINALTSVDYTFDFSPFAPAVLGFIGFTLFALFLGAKGLPDATTLHNYSKFLLGILVMFVVLDTIKHEADIRWALQLLLIGGTISALIGLLLYVMPTTISQQILVQFGRIGYPTSGRILRYVEDDTSGLMRAIGLCVDPNSYGGMLALIGSIAATQLIVARPIFARRTIVIITAIIVVALFLTFSRAALGGLIVAAIYVATVRYRRLWWLIIGSGIVATILLVFVGIGEQFVNRVVQGVQFQDRANQMRLAEYNNAIAVIQAYPFFGIGFGQAPDIDLVAGVSSIYLAIAQRIGLVGLLAFVGLMASLFVQSWRSLAAAVAHHDEIHASWLIGLQAGVVAALAVGLLDHYFFNIEFSHMTALLWCTIGLMLAVARSSTQRSEYV